MTEQSIKHQIRNLWLGILFYILIFFFGIYLTYLTDEGLCGILSVISGFYVGRFINTIAKLQEEEKGEGNNDK